MLEELNIMKLNFEVKHRFDFSGTLTHHEWRVSERDQSWVTDEVGHLKYGLQ